jgi:hypothetical protein
LAGAEAEIRTTAAQEAIAVETADLEAEETGLTELGVTESSPNSPDFLERLMVLVTEEGQTLEETLATVEAAVAAQER